MIDLGMKLLIENLFSCLKIIEFKILYFLPFFILKYCSAHPEELRDKIGLDYPESFKFFGKRL